MKNKLLKQKQARAVALELAIKTLQEAKESRGHDITDRAGDVIEDQFPSPSDTVQNAFNDSVYMIADEFETIIKELSGKLLEIGQYGSASNPK